MSTKIGLISDTHSSTTPLKQALDIFSQHHVKIIICAGDIAGYGDDQLIETIELLQQHNCLMVAGNHDHISPDTDYEGKLETIQDFFSALPLTLELQIEGKRLYVVHAHPPDSQHGGIKLLDPEGHVYADRKAYWQQQLNGLEADILIVGHTHQVFHENMDNLLLINPGSTQFNHSCMILSLPEMQVETFALGGKEIIKTWNWGVFYQQNQTGSVS